MRVVLLIWEFVCGCGPSVSRSSFLNGFSLLTDVESRSRFSASSSHSTRLLNGEILRNTKKRRCSLVVNPNGLFTFPPQSPDAFTPAIGLGEASVVTALAVPAAKITPR